MMDFQREYEQCRNAVNAALADCFTEPCEQRELLEAMRYSLLAGGKRIRPVLTVKFCELCGSAAEDALDAACAVEMLHTYSLIHDDLPCMDNDSLRRGMPTCHVVYGETVATLAGDALQAAAFRKLLSAPIPADRRAAAALSLAEAAGEVGMCGGQYLDTARENEKRDEEKLRELHLLKTGALLRAACCMGVACAGGTYEQMDAAARYALSLGLAFQIRDDVLDAVSSPETLGKNVGSDAENGKTTFLTLLGKERCEQLISRYTEEAVSALRQCFPDCGFLVWMAEMLAARIY